jgi:hypothetical protein
MLMEMKEAIGGGYIEKVPGFDTIIVDNVKHNCVALCDEHGKLKDMPINPHATELWNDALRRRGHLGLVTPLNMVLGIGGLADYLCGPIVVLYGDVLYGDQEFLRVP